MTSTETATGAMIADGVGALVAAQRPPGRLAARAFRVATGLIVAVMSLSGVANLVRPERVTVMLHHLGYPDYFPAILGTAKLLGVIAFTLPGTRRLKEWAYAGFTFDLLAALASHLATGTATHAPPAILALVLVVASYRFAHRGGAPMKLFRRVAR